MFVRATITLGIGPHSSCLLDFTIVLHRFHFCAVNGTSRLRGAPSAYSRAPKFTLTTNGRPRPHEASVTG